MAVDYNNKQLIIYNSNDEYNLNTDDIKMTYTYKVTKKKLTLKTDAGKKIVLKKRSDQYRDGQ